MKVLKEERTKGRFSHSYHVKVLTCMVNQFSPTNLDQQRLKVNVYTYLINTLFMTVRTDIGFFDRE